MTKKQTAKLINEAIVLVDMCPRRASFDFQAKVRALEEQVLLQPARVQIFLDTLATCAWLEWNSKKRRGRRAQLAAIQKWRQCALVIAVNHLARRKDWKG